MKCICIYIFFKKPVAGLKESSIALKRKSILLRTMKGVASNYRFCISSGYQILK